MWDQTILTRWAYSLIGPFMALLELEEKNEYRKRRKGKENFEKNVEENSLCFMLKFVIFLSVSSQIKHEKLIFLSFLFFSIGFKQTIYCVLVSTSRVKSAEFSLLCSIEFYYLAIPNHSPKMLHSKLMWRIPPKFNMDSSANP